MKQTIYLLLILSFCSCSSKFEQFDKCFKENTNDTIHVYSLDSYFFHPDKDALFKIDPTTLPDSLSKKCDSTYHGIKINQKIVEYFKLDTLYNHLLQERDNSIESLDKSFFGVFKYNISKDYVGYITRVEHKETNTRYRIVEYVFNKKTKSLDTAIFLAEIWQALSADCDVNSWLYDYDNDGDIDILYKSFFYDYGSMNNFTNLSDKEIFEKCKYDSAWIYLWDKDRYKSKSISFKKTPKKFKLKMLELYNGYRGYNWF